MEDPIANGWRLLKANVSLNTSPASDSDTRTLEWKSQPTEMIVAAQLLGLIERESARRFVVHCGQKTGLIVSPTPNPSPSHSRFPQNTAR